MRVFLVLLALAGCDKFIAIDFHPPPDGPPPAHDEDGDGVDDRDDNCPTIQNVQTENTDKDELGDACDPNVTTVGDKFTFYAFNNEEPDLDRATGTWNYGGGQISFTGRAEFDALIARTGAARQYSQPYTVETRFKVDNVVMFSSFSVTASLVGVLGVACALRRTPDSLGARDLVEVSKGMTKDNAQVATIDPSAMFTAKVTLSGTTASCRIDGDIPGQADSTAMIVYTPEPGYVGLEGHRMDARVDYLIIYWRE